MKINLQSFLKIRLSLKEAELLLLQKKGAFHNETKDLEIEIYEIHMKLATMPSNESLIKERI